MLRLGRPAVGRRRRLRARLRVLPRGVREGEGPRQRRVLHPALARPDHRERDRAGSRRGAARSIRLVRPRQASAMSCKSRLADSSAALSRSAPFPCRSHSVARFAIPPASAPISANVSARTICNSFHVSASGSGSRCSVANGVAWSMSLPRDSSTDTVVGVGIRSTRHRTWQRWTSGAAGTRCMPKGIASQLTPHREGGPPFPLRVVHEQLVLQDLQRSPPDSVQSRRSCGVSTGV